MQSDKRIFAVFSVLTETHQSPSRLQCCSEFDTSSKLPLKHISLNSRESGHLLKVQEGFFGGSCGTRSMIKNMNRVSERTPPVERFAVEVPSGYGVHPPGSNHLCKVCCLVFCAFANLLVHGSRVPLSLLFVPFLLC